MRRLSIALAIAVTVPSAARAQLADSRGLTFAAVKGALAAAEAEARANGWNMSIAVVDANGDLLAMKGAAAVTP